MNRWMTVPAVAVTATLLSGCGSSAPLPVPEHEAARAVQDSTAFVVQAEAATLALMQTLGGRLTAAVAESGAAHAIDFCSTVAVPLTDSVAAAHGVAMQRVTMRTRNPANTPDALDREALLHFEEVLEAGGPQSQPHVVRGADGLLRYYRPLVTAPLCLQCHGPVDALSPEVARALQSRYPDDQATGYGANELRGVIRVVGPAPGS
jgi:outer membrane murein-binding lipoprotein Lpp